VAWTDFHKASELAAIEAEQVFRGGNTSEATRLYVKAAELEEQALRDADSTKVRTRGITAVSAVSLWYKGSEYERAEQLAHSILADPSLPEFARNDLRNLVQAIWTEMSKMDANVHFLPGQVFVSVKGGEVITGGAPLDLIVEKVQTIQAMFYRTVEFISDMPLRARGGPRREILELCRPWLFQALPGSYQFSVAIQEPVQLDLFPGHVRPDLVARHFFEILEAATSEDPRQLEDVVPTAEYQNAFLKLSRNLAPNGKTSDSIEFRTNTSNSTIALTPHARFTINETLRSRRRPFDAHAEEEIVGILRAVDLDRDFLTVSVDDEPLQIVGLEDAMDDIIGPMVNKVVKVRVVRSTRGSRQFRDIEVDE